MRHSLLATCLLLTAWVEPTGNSLVPEPPAETPALTVVEKTTVGRAIDEQVSAGPAETTKEIISFDDVAMQSPPTAPLPPSISGDALAALDAVADGLMLVSPEPVPLPRHRAVPHTEVCEALASAAVVNDVPTPFFIRLIWQESGFRQDVISPAGAIGVAQFMPDTAAEHGLDDPFNPLQAVRASARFLRELIQQFGNVGLAAAAYNAGPRRVQDWLDKRGKLPQETQNYVERITGKKAEAWKVKTVAAAPIRVPERAPCQREAGLYAANGPEKIPLPPVQIKDEPLKIAKAKSATTKTASAKSVDKAKNKTTSKTASKSAKDQTKDQNKDQSQVEKTAEAKPSATATKHASKHAAKGKKVKIADAENRK
jgi:hypothetical protein